MVRSGKMMSNTNGIRKACVCSANVGYANTKVIYDNSPIIFESKISQYCDEDLKKTVFTAGERFAVGVGKHDLDMNRATSLHQKVILEYVLSKIPYDRANIVVALPCDIYLNKKAREEYHNFIVGFDKVADCLVYMEGFAAVFADLAYYRDDLRIIMDVGGKTINFMLVDKGKLVKGSAFSMNLGGLILDNKIKKTLEQSKLCVIHEAQIKYMMDDPAVKKVLEEYVTEIKNELRRHDYPTGVQIRCVGGGAVTYGDLFREKFDAYIGTDPIFENAMGMYMVGNQYWGGL